MQTIRISEKKLKIMLTETDLEKYELTAPVDIMSEGARQRLRRLLCDAGGDRDFYADDGRLFVQMYESADGGCEMFVTRLDSTYYDGGKALAPRTLTGSVACIPKYKSRVGVYEFPDLDSLLSVCGRLNAPSCGDSAAYAARDGAYYLLINEDTVPGRLTPTELLCGEYGGVLCGGAAYAYIKEHCDCICKTDAICTLAALL